MTVVLYTTLGCHLCDQARDLLLTVNPQIDIHAVDIAEDDTLIAEYGATATASSPGRSGCSTFRRCFRSKDGKDYR